MAKKIVAVNASPRKGWNTDTLVTEAAKGAEKAGAEIQKFDLFRLENIQAAFHVLAAKEKSSKAIAFAKTV